MAAASVPVLWQFKASHFNEKARWALDWKRVRHERRSLLPGFHIPVILWLTGQRAVPVLQLDGRTIPDSTAIVAALEREFPDPPLYPDDPAERVRALELEEFFDTEIGIHLRRVVFHAILPDARFTVELTTPGYGAVAKAAWGALYPVTRILMRRDMGLTDDGAARSLARVEAAFDRLERELQPSGHLVGDRFTVADLTAAALLFPLTLPAEFPYPFPATMPEAVVRLQDRFRARPGFAWARNMYRRFRGTSAAIVPGS